MAYSIQCGPQVVCSGQAPLEGGMGVTSLVWADTFAWGQEHSLHSRSLGGTVSSESLRT